MLRKKLQVCRSLRHYKDIEFNYRRRKNIVPITQINQVLEVVKDYIVIIVLSNLYMELLSISFDIIYL